MRPQASPATPFPGSCAWAGWTAPPATCTSLALPATASPRPCHCSRSTRSASSAANGWCPACSGTSCKPCSKACRNARAAAWCRCPRRPRAWPDCWADVERADFKLDMLSPHLFMNFRLVDEHGRQLGHGRNLAALKAEWGGMARGAFQVLAGLKLGQAAGPPVESKPAVVREKHVSMAAKSVAKTTPIPPAGQRYTGWTFGALPELLEISQNGQTLMGLAARIAGGDAVTIEAFDEPQVAAAQHRAGLRRLFALQIKDAVKSLEKNIPGLHAMAVAYMHVGRLPDGTGAGTPEELRKQIIDLALERAFMPDPLPADEDAFRRRVDEGRERLALIANEVARLAATILTEYAAAARKIRDTRNAPEATQDAQQQLQRLMPKNFIAATPWTQLLHYARYLKAITLRLDKIRADPARDAARLAAPRPPEQRYWRPLARPAARRRPTGRAAPARAALLAPGGRAQGRHRCAHAGTALAAGRTARELFCARAAHTPPAHRQAAGQAVGTDQKLNPAPRGGHSRLPERMQRAPARPPGRSATGAAPSIGTRAGQRRRHRNASLPAASVPAPIPAATPGLKLPPPDSRGTIHAPPLQVLAAPTAPFDHLAGHFAVGQPGHQRPPLSRKSGAGVLRPQAALPRTGRRRRAPGRLAGRAGGAAGRPGGAVHAKLPATGAGAFRHPARQCGGGAGQPDEPGRRAQTLHHRPRYPAGHHHRRPGARTGQGQQRIAARRAPGASAGAPLHRLLRRRCDRPRRAPRSLEAVAAQPDAIACARWRPDPRLGRCAGLPAAPAGAAGRPR